MGMDKGTVSATAKLLATAVTDLDRLRCMVSAIGFAMDREDADIEGDVQTGVSYLLLTVEEEIARLHDALDAARKVQP